MVKKKTQNPSGFDNVLNNIYGNSEGATEVDNLDDPIFDKPAEDNIDEIEDIKVIISEICTFFIKNLSRSTEDFEISYQVFKNKIIVTVADLNDGELSDESLNNDMSILIIESLSDNFNYDLNNKTITFEKNKIGVD